MTDWKKQSLYSLVDSGVKLDKACKDLNIIKQQAKDWITERAYKKLSGSLEADKIAVRERIKAKDSIVLAIPDLHCPFEHRDALAFLKHVKHKFNPSTIVCLGDELDSHAISRHMPDPDGHSPGKEIELAIEHLIPFYLEFPEVLVCYSNHTGRPWQRRFEAGIPKAFFRDVEKVLKAPDGWRWARRHVVDGVLYIHGDNGKSGAYAHQNYVKEAKQSVVIGHIHAHAGVQYDSELFGMNAGCLIDKDAYAFKYARNMIKGVNLGCGLVINGEVAHFIPMRVDEDNRWIGRL